MKKEQRKKLAGGGLYIVLAACVLTAMTINVVTMFTKKAPSVLPDASAVDTNAPGITDADSAVSKPAVSGKEELDKKKDEKTDPGAKAPVADTTDDVPDDTPDEVPDDTPDDAASSYLYVKPVDGEIGEYSGENVIVYSETFRDYRVHSGVDIAAGLGEPVRAFTAGIITEISDDAMMGKTVVIDHGGSLVSVYSNLAPDIPEEIAVGASVNTGDIIGNVGNTASAECADAAHLHFEVVFGGESVDPIAYFTENK